MRDERPPKQSDDHNDSDLELTDEQVRRRAWAAIALYLFVGIAVAIALIVD